MRVFLAGATGAIGRRLVPQLVEAGHEVTAVTRSEKKRDKLYELETEPILCDVFDAERLGSVVAQTEPEAVINQLTDLPQNLNPRKLKEYYAVNNRVRRDGTSNLLSAALAPGFAASSCRAPPTGMRLRAGRSRRKQLRSTWTLPRP